MLKYIKPKEILELEKTYNIILTEVEKHSINYNSTYMLNDNTYSLDSNKNIIALNMRGNQVSEIKNLDSLTALQELYLNDNQISEIKNLDFLSNLKILFLGNNKISEIKNLDSLKALEKLYLWRNQISEIKNLDSLSALKGIYLGVNQISEIKNLNSLNALQDLYLNDNQISEIKNLDSLTALEILDLNDNQISEIKNLDSLTALEKLYLRDNKINEVQEVEKLLATFNNLKLLKVHSNPFLETIGLKLETEFSSNNLYDLKNYFEDIAKDKKTIKSIKKIMLVGNHDSGKSSFLKHFLNNLTAPTESTHILNIVQYPKELKESLPEAFIYDFGGQDYYHGLYKAFMTNHATNLIFWKKETDNNNLSKDKSERTKSTQNFSKGYWIRQLHYFDDSYNKKIQESYEEQSGNKYWLIQTHIDKDNIEFLNDSKLSSKIYREFHINSRDSQDIDLVALKAHLLKNIEQRGEIERSKAYIDVVEYVLNQKKSTPTRISTITKKFPEAKERIEYILTQLSRQGLILYYPHIKSIKNIAWLNPSKIVQKIHNEIFNANSINKYRGQVPRNKFEKICNNNLRQMLLENKVIFLDEISTQEHHYIIPSYLPRINEDSTEYLYLFDMKLPCLTLKFDYFIPFGIMNRLISIYGKTPDVKKYWRDMLLFTLNTHIKIFIKLDFETLTIKLYVVGNADSTKIEIEDTQRNIFEDILALYQDGNSHQSKIYKDENSIKENLSKELHVERVIPDDLYISLDEKHFVHYSTLEDSEKTKEHIAAYKIQNNTIDNNSAVTLSTRVFKNFTTNMEISKMKKIFVSYSRKDIDYRDELRKHLNMLKIFDIADNWACEDIQIGKWHDQIQKELEESDIIIYMLSANFFSSSYILEQEVIKGMELIANNPDKKILPVIVSAFPGLDKLKSAIQNHTDEQKAILELGNFQYLAYGKDVNPVTGNYEEKIMSLKEFSNKNQLEVALSQIVEKIVEIL